MKRLIFAASLVLAVVPGMRGQTAGDLVVRAADPVEFRVGEFAFERPAEWGWVVPDSAMRKAELSVPGGGDVTFFFFGPDQGGSVEQNIQRWVNQFEGGAEGSQAMRREETFAATKVNFVTAAGTFQSGMPGGPTTPEADTGLHGAILQGKGGNVFVKMTGPKQAVEAATPAFEAMIADAAGATSSEAE